MINLYQLIYISKYCHFYIWLLHFLLSRVSTKNRSVCHGNRIAIVLHSSHEHVVIETRERGCIANKRSGRGLSMIEVKVVDRRDSAWHGTMRQSCHDLRSKRFALSSDLQLWSSFFTDDATFLRENVRNGAMCDVLVILLNQNAPRLD